MSIQRLIIKITNKEIWISLFVILVAAILIAVYFSQSETKQNKSEQENPLSVISRFIESNDFNSIFIGEIKFEDKEVARYSKDFESESESTIDQLISWGKSKAFSVKADLHLVVESSFSVNNSKIEIMEEGNTILIKLSTPKLATIDVNYSKTVVDFKEIGLLANEEDREIFVIKEVFNENIEEYKLNTIRKNTENAKSKATRILKRSLLGIINMNKIIEIQFID